MSKFKKLTEDILNSKQREEEQKLLREKHADLIIDENIVIVEKSNVLKFLINAIVSMIKVTASIAMILLCSLAIISLIYEESRLAIFNVLTSIYTEVKSMF